MVRNNIDQWETCAGQDNGVMLSHWSGCLEILVVGSNSGSLESQLVSVSRKLSF
jgi:hypothetical protein